MELGSDIPTETVDKIKDSMKPEQCGLLIYTVSVACLCIRGMVISIVKTLP